MLYKFFSVQWRFPVKGDWTETVKADLRYLEMDFTVEQIKKYKKENFAKIVKSQVNKIALRDLCEKKENLTQLSTE